MLETLLVSPEFSNALRVEAVDSMLEHPISTVARTA